MTAAAFGRSFVQVVVLLAGVLFTGTEAGLAAAPLLTPVATTYLAAAPVPAVLPVPGVLRSAYSQVVGRSYAPSFVPVASSLAYAAPAPLAPVARAIPTAYVAPQLVAGPVLKTIATPTVASVPLATRFAAFGAPLGYAGPVPVAPVVRAAPVPTTAVPFGFASRFAPLPAPVGPAAVPLGGVAPVASLPGVVDAREAVATPSGVATRTAPTSFLTAFGSQEGIRLVGGPGLEGPALTGVASTNVESARAAPAVPQNTVSGRIAPSAQPSANPETFGVVPQPTPFAEYGAPAAASVAPIAP